MLPGGANQTAQVDLGRQISDVVAQIDGLGATDIAGAAGSPATGTHIGTAGVAGGAGDRAGGAAGQAGGALPGSVGVSTLVVTNVAFVGIDTNTLARGAGNERGSAGGAGGTAPGIVGAPGGAGDPTGVADRVRAEVMASFPQIADVFVTTDPDLVSRIARVAGNVQSGVSMAGQMAEVAAITREMALPNASDRDRLPGSR